MFAVDVLCSMKRRVTSSAVATWQAAVASSLGRGLLRRKSFVPMRVIVTGYGLTVLACGVPGHDLSGPSGFLHASSRIGEVPL